GGGGGARSGGVDEPAAAGSGLGGRARGQAARVAGAGRQTIAAARGVGRAIAGVLLGRHGGGLIARLGMSTPGTEYLTPAAGDGSGRVRRSVGTWITGLGATAAVALAGFIATPLLVRWLGDSAWGAWTVVGEWLGYLGISQLAFGPGAASIFLLRAHSAGTPGALTAMARRWFRLYCWAAVGLLPAALALAWWAPHVLHPGPALARSLQWAVGIAAVGSV